LVELAKVKLGNRILDIATGYGEPSITAAKYIQARDSVLDVDISAQMLEIAKERSTNRGGC